jgi:hypothetical protein
MRNKKKDNFNPPLQLTLVSHISVSSAEPKQTPPLAAPVQLRVPIQKIIH